MKKYVTMGWDFEPTIVNEDGTIYPRAAELIFHKKYYPDWPNEKWPVDPETGEKLEIEELNKNPQQDGKQQIVYR